MGYSGLYWGNSVLQWATVGYSELQCATVGYFGL
jgi:hypothetical protein